MTGVRVSLPVKNGSRAARLVVVDFAKNELVSGDPQLVECRINRLG